MCAFAHTHNPHAYSTGKETADKHRQWPGSLCIPQGMGTLHQALVPRPARGRLLGPFPAPAGSQLPSPALSAIIGPGPTSPGLSVSQRPLCSPSISSGPLSRVTGWMGSKGPRIPLPRHGHWSPSHPHHTHQELPWRVPFPSSGWQKPLIRCHEAPLWGTEGVTEPLQGLGT